MEAFDSHLTEFCSAFSTDVHHIRLLAYAAYVTVWRKLSGAL